MKKPIVERRKVLERTVNEIPGRVRAHTPVSLAMVPVRR